MNKLEQARQTIGEIDSEMAALFERRMAAVRGVAEYKKENGLPVLDAAREEELLRRNTALLSDPALTREYVTFQRGVMAASRAYQHRLLSDLHVSLGGGRGYDIVISRGGLFRAGGEFNLARRVLVVTDSGVPSQYARCVLSQCKEPTLATLPAGEASKSLSNYEKLLGIMMERGFTRSDCVVAVGGGVVGDIAGFAAACFMRGVDFYNIPTTLLSQVDSSVGGKTAVDFRGVKNPVGAFKQPEKVLIDPEVLTTLPPREFAAGMAEVIKMAATHDAALFEKIEREDPHTCIEEIISAALRIKRSVVEEDETEGGLRRVLNFGHTVGHAIESAAGGRLLHGECVALGMLPMCAPAVRQRLIALYRRLGLPTAVPVPPAALTAALAHDKKLSGSTLTYVWVEEVGSYAFRTCSLEEFCRLFTEGDPT